MFLHRRLRAPPCASSIPSGLGAGQKVDPIYKPRKAASRTEHCTVLSHVYSNQYAPYSESSSAVLHLGCPARPGAAKLATPPTGQGRPRTAVHTRHYWSGCSSDQHVYASKAPCAPLRLEHPARPGWYGQTIDLAYQPNKRPPAARAVVPSCRAHCPTSMCCT